MIQVTIYKKDNFIEAFELSGHADSGPYGYDLVCAGVSAVSFGTVNAVIALCEIDLEIKQGTDGGYLYVKLPYTLHHDQKEKADTLLAGMLIALQTIERDYAQFINVKVKEGGAGHATS